VDPPKPAGDALGRISGQAVAPARGEISVFESPEELARLIDEFYPYRNRFATMRRLPAEGRPTQDVLDELTWMAELEDEQGHRGQVSGSLYHGGTDHYAVLNRAFALFAHANVLRPRPGP
jgi:sphinganine-1-phosphate aldolase